ncbi:MAG: SH3 domain-containing protein [Candidatus Accumulibacter sp.]|nr:SH3 domain-containing protein [Accumulibacter sp.]
MRRLPILISFIFIASLSLSARSAEYRTVESATILYDTPNLKGTRLFVVRRDTPVEVVVNQGGWVKVRDAEGSLAWIEKKELGTRRTLIVKADRASILQNPEEDAPVVFEAERNVSLDYVDPMSGGWIKVRHRDGQEGFARAEQVWGF